MNIITSRVIARVSASLTLLPILVGLVRFRQLNRLQLKIWIMMLVYGMFELLGQRFSLPFWEWLTGEARNLPGLHLLVIAQFALVVWIYQEMLSRFLRPWMIYGLVGGFTLFAIYNGLYLDLFRNMNPRARGVQCLILIPIILTYFYQLLQSKEMRRLEKDPLFWISAGFIIYFAGSFLIFIASNILLPSAEVFRAFLVIHSMVNVLLILLATVALWIRPQQ